MLLKFLGDATSTFAVPNYEPVMVNPGDTVDVPDGFGTLLLVSTQFVVKEPKPGNPAIAHDRREFSPLND